MEMARDDRIASYHNAVFRKRAFMFSGLLLLLFALAFLALLSGGYGVTAAGVAGALLGRGSEAFRIVVWEIRIPRIAAAMVAGWGLGLSGLSVQSFLKNPIGSPFTLGISQGAAFGASFVIVFLGDRFSMDFFHLGAGLVTLAAFSGAILATVVILFLTRIKKMTPESIILAGVAISSLFTSGTILVQYFASETEIASAVFWTFGDVGRATIADTGVMALVVLPVTLWLILHSWDLNALGLGDDSAISLGVDVDSLRVVGMSLAAMAAASVTAFLGVIAFLGLLAPHIARKMAGSDHRLLIPFSGITGSILLLLADTAGRLMTGSGSLPVGVLTSFLGAPLFLYLLIRRTNNA